MIVIALSATPARLRGALTRWLVEVSTGVYVGRVSARVRDQLWELIENNLERGRATLIYPAHNEQGFVSNRRVMIGFQSIMKACK